MNTRDDLNGSRGIKNAVLIALLFWAAVFLLSGCDSPTPSERAAAEVAR